MKTTRTYYLMALFGTILFLALPAQAADVIRYAEEDGTLRTAQIHTVRKDTEKEFSATIFLGGRKRKLSIPSRFVVELRRGDPDAVNQWSKGLARGKQLLAVGRLATVERVPGAEETFTKIAYTTEQGVPGEEKSTKVWSWHNMYATYYLIETRYRMGLGGQEAKLKAALDAIAMFKKRCEGRPEHKMNWAVPAEEGTRPGKVYAWGSSRLLPEVMLFEARCHAALKDTAKAAAAYDDLIQRIRKNSLSPALLTTAYMESAELDAAGKASDEQESIFRKVGTTMASLARTQRDEYGKRVLKAAANRALLRGADLLLESADQKKVSYDVPLRRYEALKAGEGTRDPALYIGAATGIGVCLAESGKGEQAYRTLLEVVVKGADYPHHMARALYFLGRASKMFADEVDSAGGQGDFLRAESGRWWTDLKERYPSSEWAKKAQ